jgi:hypothetical protein
VSTTVVSIGEEKIDGDDDDVLDSAMQIMDSESPYLFDSLNCLSSLRGEYRPTMVDSRKATFTEQYGREVELRKMHTAERCGSGNATASSSAAISSSPAPALSASSSAAMSATLFDSGMAASSSSSPFVDSSGRIRFHVLLSGVPLVLSTSLAATLGGSTPPHLISLTAALGAMQRSRKFVICRPCTAEPEDDTAVIVYTKDMLEYLSSKERDAASAAVTGEEDRISGNQKKSAALPSSSSSSTSTSLVSSSPSAVETAPAVALQHVSLACSFYRQALLPDCHWGRESKRWIALDELEALFSSWWEEEQRKLTPGERETGLTGRHHRLSPTSGASTAAEATSKSGEKGKRRRRETAEEHSIMTHTPFPTSSFASFSSSSSSLSKKKGKHDVDAIFRGVQNTLVRMGLLFGRVDVTPSKATSYWFGVPDSGLLWTHLTAGKGEFIGKLKARRYQELPRKEAEGINLVKTCLPSAFIIKHLLETSAIRSVQTASGAYLKLPM